MSALMQVCAVIVTLAIATIAIATIRAMRRFEVASHEFTRMAETIRESALQAEIVTRQLQDLAVAMQSVMPPIRNAASRLEALTERATDVSHAMLDQVESPIRNTLAVLTGLRAGTRSLLGSLGRRAGHQQSNGGYDHA